MKITGNYGMTVKKKLLTGVSVFSLLAASAFLPQSAEAAKLGSEYLLYSKTNSNYHVYSAYNISSGKTINIISEEDKADSVDLSDTAKSHIFLSAFRSPDSGVNLYSTNLKKGVRTQLNSPLPAGGSVIEWDYTPSNKFAFYLADQEADEKYDIYVTSTKKSKPKKLNSWYEGYEDLSNSSLYALPNGKGLFYTAGPENGDREGLFLSLTKERLSRAVVLPSGEGSYVYVYTVNPRSTGVVYETNSADTDNYINYYYDIKSDTSTRIEIPEGTDFHLLTGKFDSAGKNFYFVGSPKDSDYSSVYKYDIARRQTTRIGEEMGQNNSAGAAIHLDPKGKTLYYTHDKATSSVYSLYALNLKSNTSTLISEPGKNVEKSAVDLAGNLYYTYDEEDAQNIIVYRKPAKKGDTTVVLDTPPNGLWGDIMLSETGAYITYSYYTEFFQSFTQLFNVPTGENLDLETLIPDARYPFLLDEIYFEITRLPL